MPAESLNKKEEKILELENRKNIYGIVKKYSGCHFREIERRSSLPHGTLKYHLNFLIKHNLLIYKKENNNVRYFPKNFQTDNIELLSILRQNNLRKIILFIIANNNSNHENIARFMNLAPSTVSWHLKKLLEKRIINVARKGRKTVYTLSINKDEILKLLIAHKESFLDSLVNKAVDMWEVK